MDVSTQILGFEDLEAQLNRLVDLAEQEKYTYRATSYGLTPIIKEAKRLAPKADQAYYRYYRGSARQRRRGNPQNSRKLVEPGNLKKSIKRKKVKLDGSRGTAIQISRKLGFYWRFLEYGTPKMYAVPFLRPAFDAKKQMALDRFKSKYRAFIQDIIQRQAIELGADEGDD